TGTSPAASSSAVVVGRSGHRASRKPYPSSSAPGPGGRVATAARTVATTSAALPAADTSTRLSERAHWPLWMCWSHRPGTTHRPSASSSSPPAARSGPTSTTRPPSIRTSTTALAAWAGPGAGRRDRTGTSRARRTSRRVTSEVAGRVEARERDDPDARERCLEGAEVVLEVVDPQPAVGELGEVGVDELAEADDPDLTAGVDELLHLGQEVAVVAGEEDVALGLLRDRLEGPLDADVDDLLGGRGGERDRVEAHREQRLDEAHGHLTGARAVEEQPLGRLVVDGVGEVEDAVPARLLLGGGTPAEHAHAEGGVDVLPVDEEVGARSVRPDLTLETMPSSAVAPNRP